MEDIRATKRHARELAKALKELSGAVTIALQAIDIEMQQPSTPERGKRIAKVCNALDFANDKVRYFSLGVDYHKDKKMTSFHKEVSNG